MSEEAPAPSGRSADGGVDAALERLAELSKLPAAERVGSYDEVHRRLAAALADKTEGVPE